MSRLKNLGIVEPVLTELARGYKNAAFVAESTFPVVESGKEFGKIPNFSKEALKIYSTERAIRAASNEISPDDRDSIPFIMDEHDLSYPVDYREEDADLFDAKKNASNVVNAGIDLKREYIAATLAQNEANFATGNKITLSGTSQFTHASSDPIGIIDDATEKLAETNADCEGILTMTMGIKTYRALKKHPQLIEKIKYSMKGIATVDIMKEVFDIPNIVIGKSMFWDEINQKFVRLWGDNIILAIVPKQATNYEVPSFGYTIRKKGMPMVDSYPKPGGKILMIRRTDIYTVKQCSNVAGYLIKDTNV